MGFYTVYKVLDYFIVHLVTQRIVVLEYSAHGFRFSDLQSEKLGSGFV